MNLETDFKTIIIVILLGFLGWYFFIRNDEPPPANAPTVADEPADIAKTPRREHAPYPFSAPPSSSSSNFPYQPLLNFVQTNIDRICSPLQDPRGAQIAMTDLYSIRAVLNQERKKFPASTTTSRRNQADLQDAEALNQAEALYKQIYSAIAERYTHEARLASAFAKSSQATDSGKTDDFFERNIRSAWEHKASQLYRDIQKSTTTLQNLDKQ